MTVYAVPKPPPREKKTPKPLPRPTKPLPRSTAPIAKRGTTKAKKVIRQKAFYASAVWKRIRKEAIARAGGRCEYTATLLDQEMDPPLMRVYRCGAEFGLQVHHRSNVRFGGHERPGDLQCLCVYHHREIERRDHPTRARRF